MSGERASAVKVVGSSSIGSGRVIAKGMDQTFLDAVRYRCIGPTRAGRVVAVAADPVDRNTFYFGACAGGVWKTHDAGTYWECITDGFLKTASIGALAVAPSDPNVIYAGTGEATIRIDVSHGDGVYRSTNAGKTWSHVGLTESRHIGEIVIDPRDPDVVFVAALGHMSKDNPERGVYRSTNGGGDWELVLSMGESAGAIDLSLDPNNPRILFATTWNGRRNFWSMNSGGDGCGLWRSADSGDTWEDLTNRPGLPEGIVGKIGVAISPANSERIWVLVEAEKRDRGLYRSDDGGETWTKTSSKAELAWRPWYYMHVFAHPTDPDTVYVMNAQAWKSIDGGKEWEEFHTPHGDNHDLWIDPNDPQRMIGGDDGGAWVSLNDGVTWSPVYNQLTAQFYHVAVDDQFPYLVYGTQQDNSSIAVPSRTYTSAISWSDCFAAGTGESGYIAPKPDDPNIVFLGAIGSSPGGGDALQRYDHRTKQIQLVSVWPESAHDGNSADVRFQWTYPIVFSPQDPNTLYVAGNKVFRSINEGYSWDTISPDLTHADPETMGVSGPLTMDSAGAEMYATIFSLMVSAHNQGTLMSGSDDGRVFVTTDDGGSWDEVTPPDLPKFSQITMLEESPHTADTVYLTAARHKHGEYHPIVMKTTDLGQTWTAITNGIPADEFCRVVREDPKRQGLLYVGTELGVHVSFDDGQNWQPLQANLPVTPVYDLIAKHDDLVVATHGRSFWILDDLTQLHQLFDEAPTGNHLFKPRDTVRTPPHIFAGFWGGMNGKNYHVTLGQNATFYVDEAETGHKTKRIIDAGDDIPEGVQVSWYFDEAPEGEAILTFTDSAGKEVSSHSSVIPKDKADRVGVYITAGKGMNSFQWSMRHDDGPKMADTEYHGAPRGPLALPGEYTATLTTGDSSMSQSFNLVTDPRVTVTHDDLVAQHSLLSEIKATLTEIVEGVNLCRKITVQLNTMAERVADQPALKEKISATQDSVSAVETQLVQPELKSRGDSLNYRVQLYGTLSDLVPVVSSADAAPTQQSHDVYTKLKAKAAELLGQLAAVQSGPLAELNTALADANVDIVGG